MGLQRFGGRLAASVFVVTASVTLAACAPEPTPYVTVTVSTTETVTADPGEGIGGVVEDVIEDAIDTATEFVMPDVVGMNLQEAQDLLQTEGSFFMDQEDASGEGRLQVDDSNWHVCTQDPKAGETASKVDLVTLNVVKIGEDCP